MAFRLGSTGTSPPATWHRHRIGSVVIVSPSASMLRVALAAASARHRPALPAFRVSGAGARHYYRRQRVVGSQGGAAPAPGGAGGLGVGVGASGGLAGPLRPGHRTVGRAWHRHRRSAGHTGLRPAACSGIATSGITPGSGHPHSRHLSIIRHSGRTRRA